MKIRIKDKELEEERIDDDFYTNTRVDLQLEDDEISPMEEAFMSGYLES